MVGLQVSWVKLVLRQRAELGGPRFHSPEALINTVLDVQVDEVPEPDISEFWYVLVLQINVVIVNSEPKRFQNKTD